MLRDCDEVLLVGLVGGERSWAVRVRPHSVALVADTTYQFTGVDWGTSIDHLYTNESRTKVMIDGVAIGEVVFYPQVRSAR